MVTSTPSPQSRIDLPIYEDRVRMLVEQERERLAREAGIPSAPATQYRKPPERRFTRQERGKTTVLFGGLTFRHERLIQSALEGLGYKIGIVPTPKKADFQAGKEFGNNGQCNPTYFTVGALVNYLRDLRDNQGLATDQILDDFAFITAGACGPCRFGMYEAEYRLALRNSGFDGFRVLLFDQSGGIDQKNMSVGFEFNFDFMLSLLNSIFLGDLLNEVAYQIRPYEKTPGATQAVMDRAVEVLRGKLRNKAYSNMTPTMLAKVISRITPAGDDVKAQKFLDQVRSDFYTRECKEIASWIDEEIEVDFTRAKPIVKITGEFWAQTTEGDGNFNMFPFLEREGAEVLVEPITTWVGYLLHQAIIKAGDARGLVEGQEVPGGWDLKGRWQREVNYRSKIFKLHAGRLILEREYERLRQSLGGTAHKLANQKHLERVGHPYYNSRSGGGEGHLEVAKNIYYASKKYAHMVLSVKPFGCMPSTQSDGAQAAVVSHFPDIIYLPIETSGEGDVNAHSRVQMALGEAKVRCRAEFQQEVQSSGYSLEQIRAYVDAHRELRKPISVMKSLPHDTGLVSRAANFIRFVGKRMRSEGVQASA